MLSEGLALPSSRPRVLLQRRTPPSGAATAAAAAAGAPRVTPTEVQNSGAVGERAPRKLPRLQLVADAVPGHHQRANTAGVARSARDSKRRRVTSGLSGRPLLVGGD